MKGLDGVEHSLGEIAAAVGRGREAQRKAAAGAGKPAANGKTAVVQPRRARAATPDADETQDEDKPDTKPLPLPDLANAKDSDKE
ncbi:hypothetical protein [Bosea sp. TAB14]|uniref:hypothetical protein n=1 Tax=Bosea sp. TAB14 TaxID=3237481 RepID=UPI003F93684F